jgi:hypothetical protein
MTLPAQPGHGHRNRDRGGSTAERLRTLMAEDTSDANVRDGLVHPQIYDYLRDARRLFTPTLATVERQLGAPTLPQAYAKDDAKSLACDVCLVVAPDAPPRAELQLGSDSEEFNRMAIAALTAAAGSRPRDADLAPQRACYRFRASVRRIPLTLGTFFPMCGFEETTLKLSCAYPFKKVFRSSINLVSVNYGG